MNRLCAALSLLALTTMPVGSTTAASPRDAPEYYVTPPPETPEEQHSRRVGEMEALLHRLVGKFGVERPWEFSQPPPSPNAARTMWDCVAIGEGVGVHCVVLMVPPKAAPARQAGAGRNQQSPILQLRPRPPMISSLTEYGIDPNAWRVRLMKVDRGTAARADGRVIDYTLTTWNEIEQRIVASADSEDIWVTEYKDWNRSAHYALRRLTQEEADTANWSVEGARPTFPTKPSRPR